MANDGILLCARINAGAGDGDRTHIASLEGWSSTIELHPHLSDPSTLPPRAVVEGVGFEPTWAYAGRFTVGSLWPLGHPSAISRKPQQQATAL